ncbi:MAG: hypothetical protein ACI4RP_02095 [Acutalibacteraceae bacterium]
MNVLDNFSRANTPHPAASPPPSPQGEGLTCYDYFLIQEPLAATTITSLSTLHS